MAGKRRDKGQGGITKRKDGRWQASFQDAQGRRRTVYGKTKREAQQKLTAAIVQREQGTLPEPGSETLEQFLQRWLRDVKAFSVRRGTMQFYAERIKFYIAPTLGKMLPRAIGVRDIQALYADLQRGGLSPTTVRGVHGTLHAALQHALAEGLVGRNILDAVTPPERSGFRAQVLSREQLQHLLEVIEAEGHRLGLFLLVMATTGMRLGEMRGLHVNDVDLERRELKVLWTVDDPPGGGRVLAPPKSRRGKRTVALGTTAITAIKDQLQRMRLQKMAAGPKWEENGLLFPNGLGRPLREDTPREYLYKLLEKAKLPHLRPHDLRHTHATLLLLDGVPVHVVAERLGDDPATVLRTYAHLLPSSQPEAAARFERILGR